MKKYDLSDLKLNLLNLSGNFDPHALVDYEKINGFLRQIKDIVGLNRILKHFDLSFELKPLTLLIIKSASKKECFTSS